MQARRGGVDDEVEALPGQPVAGLDVDRRHAGKLLAQRLGPGLGAVDDDEPGGARLGHGQHRAPRRAAGAEDQHALAANRKTQALLDVIYQADAVGVVTEDAVGVEAQGVHRLRQACPLGEGVGQREGLDLERHGHVHAAPAGLAEGLDGGAEAVERPQDRLVADVLAALAGKGRVQGGRLGVGDRVADHGVAVSHVKTSAGGGPNSSNQRPAMARWSTSTTRFTSSTGTWPGAELCSPTAKLTDEPKTQPHSRLTAP